MNLIELTWFYVKENTDALPLEQERLQRLKVLIENGHGESHIVYTLFRNAKIDI